MLQTITSCPPLDDRQLDNPNSPSVILHDRIIPDQLSALTLVDGQHLNKVVFTLYHGDFYQLKSFCQQEFTIPGLHVTFSSNHSIELSNIAHTKGLALKEIAQKLKVPLNQILALGDAGNDISMLSIPGITAVCASWSQPEVLAVSSHHFPGKAGTWILNAFQQLLVKDHQKGIE